MQTHLILKLGNRTFNDPDVGPPDGASLWESCPVLANLTDRSVLAHLEDDFLPYQSGRWTVTTFTSGSAVQGLLLGGTVALGAGATTAGQGVQIQSPAIGFGYSADKMLWAEASLQVNLLSGRFVWGLAGAGTLVSGTSLASADFVGFASLAGDGVVRFQSAQSGGSSSSAGAVKTLTPATWTRLGFVWDMGIQTVTCWVNGVAGPTLSTSGALPTNLLTPSFACLASGAGTPQLDLDAVRVAQLRGVA